MSASFLDRDRLLAGGKLGSNPASAANPAFGPGVLRAMLLAGCALAVALAASLGDPASYLVADPQLARLLRGMALIKGAIALAAAGALWWRLKWPISGRMAAAYLAGGSLLAGASMMVWQLTMIPLAAIGFHAVEISLLCVAWRDHRGETGGQVA